MPKFVAATIGAVALLVIALIAFQAPSTPAKPDLPQHETGNSPPLRELDNSAAVPSSAVGNPASASEKDIVSHSDSSIDEDTQSIVDSFHKDADRIEYVLFDANKFISLLRFSPAYMYAEAGSLPPPPNRGRVDFEMKLFEDQVFEFQIQDVNLPNVDGSNYLIIQGRLVGGGNFRLSGRADGSLINGFIDTPEAVTRIDTWKVSPKTVVAQYSRSTVRRLERPID